MLNFFYKQSLALTLAGCLIVSCLLPAPIAAVTTYGGRYVKGNINGRKAYISIRANTKSNDVTIKLKTKENDTWKTVEYKTIPHTQDGDITAQVTALLKEHRVSIQNIHGNALNPDGTLNIEKALDRSKTKKRILKIILSPVYVAACIAGEGC